MRAWETAQALHFTVTDTGRGFDPNGKPSGTGLSNMHDRIAAVGGTLTVDSRPSHGTRLHGSVPNPGRTQPQDGHPRFEPLRPPISAAPQRDPGPRHVGKLN